MNLKEVIADDVDLVLDLDDFAETVIIENEPIKAQIDSRALAELSGETDLALGLDALVIYARTSDLPKPRKPGDALSVGYRDWMVLNWENRAGITTITLQRTT